ncbi:hypothetical protein [Fusobacterium nucleatum]|nr:hypothetical protein [Fusobacterium nucleatum]
MENKSDDFKKASVMKVIKFKVKWLLKLIWYCINRPIEILLKWA